jgi:citrate/tricarballylate utilization protein
MAQLRLVSYERYCWPGVLGSAFRRAGVAGSIGLALAASVLVAVMAFLLAPPRAGSAPADFYSVVPHGAMVALFGGVSLFIVAALGIGLRRFWRDVNEGDPVTAGRASVIGGLREALTLAHLHDNDVDCTRAEEQRSPLRRWFHHATTGGFGLCFASTTVAAIYHSVLGWHAPYPMTSVPVVLGLLGGIGLVVGPVGLFVERRRRDPALSDPAQHGLDESFITLLLVTSATGLLLLAFREQRAVMAGLLIAHLGSVLALFATLPYGKFVHGIYRTAALVKYAAERARDEQTTGAAAPQGAIVRNEPRIPAPAEAAPALPGE